MGAGVLSTPEASWKKIPSVLLLVIKLEYDLLAPQVPEWGIVLLVTCPSKIGPATKWKNPRWTCP
jgi:hypothetical protein